MPEEIDQVNNYMPNAEEIAGHYRAALDSVNLINRFVALETLEQEDRNAIERNVSHLEIMLRKDYWTTEDLTPFSDAVTAGRAAIAE